MDCILAQTDIYSMKKSDTHKDNVFAIEGKGVEDFSFNHKVVSVFDDMVERSVPFYGEMQRMTAELAADFAVNGSAVCDVGCSTGTTLIALDRAIDPSRAQVSFQGFDNSAEMLKKAEIKLTEYGMRHAYRLSEVDVHKGLAIENASVVTMLLTLQFIRPLHRERLVREIFTALNDNGALMLVEKVTSEDTIFNRLFINHYYEYKKRNGYSEMEIANKREALENVLIPYRMEENFDLLRLVGFQHVEVFFRWYNFCGIIAVK